LEKKKNPLKENPSYDDNQGIGGQLLDMVVHTCGLFVANAFG